MQFRRVCAARSGRRDFIEDGARLAAVSEPRKHRRRHAIVEHALICVAAVSGLHLRCRFRRGLLAGLLGDLASRRVEPGLAVRPPWHRVRRSAILILRHRVRCNLLRSRQAKRASFAADRDIRAIFADVRRYSAPGPSRIAFHREASGQTGTFCRTGETGSATAACRLRTMCRVAFVERLPSSACWQARAGLRSLRRPW